MAIGIAASYKLALFSPQVTAPLKLAVWQENSWLLDQKTV
jgi:hypothetical protein